MPFSAPLLLSFCQVFGYPISWKKLQCGPKVQYIGWDINLRAGVVSLPDDKIVKLLSAILEVLQADTITVKALESLIGVLHWVMQLSPVLKPWLCSLYHDAARPLATNFSVSMVVWQRLSEFLSTDMVFKHVPPGTSISVGSRLISARHVNLTCLNDLKKVKCTGRRVWLRVADIATVKRKLSQPSRQFLEFWLQWCTQPKLFYPLQLPKFDFSLQSAADACASGSSIGIGGWVRLPGQPVLWFSERFQVEQFRALGIQVRDPALSDIVAYELLAQIALVVCLATACRGGRLSLCMPSLSDNTGAEAMIHKMFTVEMPLCFFVHKLATVSWQSGITLDTSHICGVKNSEADFLSCWDGSCELPPVWDSSFRVSCDLSVIWDREPDVRLFPADAQLLWKPPLRATASP